MIKINILDNKKCQIIIEDESVFKRLYRFLSFKLSGIEYTPAFKNGWSGITYLMTKNGKFSLGLLPKVKKFLEDANLAFEVNDTRPAKQINPELDISERLKELKLVPREHQIRSKNIIDLHDRGIVRVVTGGGKSLIIALMAAKLNKPTIIYVIGLDLLDQFYKLFCKIFDEKIGYIGNGICEPARITIASIWTVGRALSIDKKNIVNDDNDITEKELNPSNYSKIKEVLKQAKVHIIDESHVVTTSTITEIYNNIDPEYIYGFSGTPFRDDNSDLLINSILGEQVINVTASELISKGLLATPIIKFVTVPKMTVSDQYQAAYKEYISENEARNNLIVQQTKELLEKNYTPLVLFKQIKHGDILFEKMQEQNIKCAMLHGNDSLDERNEVKQNLIDKKIDVILASTIFDIGLNLEELNALVLCGGGKSSIRALQRIGRVLRMRPGKKYAAVVDFYDQAKFFKKHATLRYQIYKSEPGFKIIKTKEMK